MKPRTVPGFFVVAGTLIAILAGCNGNSTAPPPLPVFTPVPFLVSGTTSHFSGKYSEVITYASPTAQQPNSIGAYTTTDVQTVSSSPPSAPAPFHVHRQFTYTVVKVPTSGIEQQQRKIDSYESSTLGEGSQTIAQTSTTTAITGIDQTASRLEKYGPYSYKSTNTIAYASPRVLFKFPFVEGTTNVPLARTEKLIEKVSNRSGHIYLERNITTTYADTGAFHNRGTIGPSEITSASAKADGSAIVLNQGGALFEEIIELPVVQNGSYFIPVTRDTGTTQKKYLAADWYPGNAAPPSALLPTACNVTTPVKNVEEVTSSSTTLNVIAATYTTAQTQTYLSNNLVVCRMNSSKSLSYAIETGLPLSTTVDALVEGLTATTKS
jgi:hypothetical protein